MGNKGSPGHTYAFNPGNGHIVWRYHDGEYHGPIVAAGRLVIAGLSTLHVLHHKGH